MGTNEFAFAMLLLNYARSPELIVSQQCFLATLPARSLKTVQTTTPLQENLNSNSSGESFYKVEIQFLFYYVINAPWKFFQAC